MTILTMAVPRERRAPTRMALFVAWSLALLALGLASPAALAAQSTGTILGRVVSAATREAIPGVVVRLPATESGAVIAVLSDSVGRFVLRNVPVGVTRLELRRLGFAPVDPLLSFDQAESRLRITERRTSSQMVFKTYALRHRSIAVLHFIRGA